MANTFLDSISTAEQFLLTSTKFWSSLSTVAVAGAISAFYSTQQYTNTFTDTGKYIFSAIIILHFILFFSNSLNLKNKFAPFFLGSTKKWIIRITAISAASLLNYVPEQSIIGLIFVICVWIDIIAVDRIVRSSIDLWIINSVFMAIVNRSIELYGFNISYWLIMLFCFPLIYVQVRLDGYKNEET